jgi:transposase
MEDRVNRHDLSDAEWERLSPLLPANPRQGGRWADHRMVINGVFFRIRTDIPWRDLPPCYGNWKTVYNRHRRWSMDGTWG